MCNILILFDSDTQKNEHLADTSKVIMTKLGVEIRIKRVESIGVGNENTEEHYQSDIEVVCKDDLSWADGFVFNFPIHTGAVSASMKYFFDSYHKVAVEGIFLNKPATVMSIGKLSHAGAETAILQLHSMLMQWGTLIVSTSILFSDIMNVNGNPYGLSFILDSKDSFGDVAVLECILNEHFKRFVYITKSLTGEDSSNLKFNNKPYTITDTLS